MAVSPGARDQKRFDQIGGVRDVIACGRAELDLARQPDEYVAVEDLVASAEGMALAASRPLTARV
jgi:succinyl-diaminopimelate desuccinylase